MSFKTINVKSLIIISLIILSFNSYSQTKKSAVIDTTIFADPVVLPSFPGGTTALRDYIDKNFSWAQGQLTVEGRVYVEFLVRKNGKVKHPLVVKGLCNTCDKEAIRLVKNMPTWIPGSENGEAVEMKMVLPIWFEL